jgi:hypothetical protein
MEFFITESFLVPNRAEVRPSSRGRRCGISVGLLEGLKDKVGCGNLGLANSLLTCVITVCVTIMVDMTKHWGMFLDIWSW